VISENQESSNGAMLAIRNGMDGASVSEQDIETFIARWSDGRGRRTGQLSAVSV
jgi:hypothetical protein